MISQCPSCVKDAVSCGACAGRGQKRYPDLRFKAAVGALLLSFSSGSCRKAAMCGSYAVMNERLIKCYEMNDDRHLGARLDQVAPSPKAVLI